MWLDQRYSEHPLSPPATSTPEELTACTFRGYVPRIRLGMPAIVNLGQEGALTVRCTRLLANAPINHVFLAIAGPGACRRIICATSTVIAVMPSSQHAPCVQPQDSTSFTPYPHPFSFPPSAPMKELH